jgi:uncharacterized protein YggT (Ycf19 family)
MLLISIAKALIEIAGMCVIAHMLVALFSPATRQNNVIYRLFAVIAQPVYSAVRRVMPALVLDQHIPLASLLSLLTAWLFTVYFKAQALGLLG